MATMSVRNAACNRLSLNGSTLLRIRLPRNSILKKSIIRHVASAVGSCHEQTRAPSAGEPALSTSNLVTLAAKIAQETEKISSYMKENGLPEPSFNADSAVGFSKLPDALQAARGEVIKATKELSELLTGAEQGLRCLAWDVWTPFSEVPHRHVIGFIAE